MKMACHSVGVGFPAYVMAADLGDVEDAARELRFPLIVKHPHGYSSVGLTPESRVEDREALHRQAARVIEAYGSALVEEFIEGREFTVLVAEPRGGWEETWGFRRSNSFFPRVNRSNPSTSNGKTMTECRLALSRRSL